MELYLLDEDPGETRDRSKDFPKLVEEMMGMLDNIDWPDTAVTSEEAMDPDLRRRLEALGYLK